MTLTQVTLSLSALGVAVTGALAILFLRDPVFGMAQTTHRAEKLPEVMTNRYIAFCALALAATLYGDLYVISILFGAFAFMGFADAWTYGRGGFSIAKHMAAGILASIVVIVALLALNAEEGGL